MKRLTLEEYLILNASDIKIDCCKYDFQTGSCSLWGSPCCENCTEYLQKDFGDETS